MLRLQLDIRRAREEVFDYFADFRNENEWNPVASNLQMLSTGAIGRGSRFRGDYQRMGVLQYEILEHEPPRHLRVKGTSRSFDFESAFDFSEHPGGTRIEMTMDPHPKGFYKLLSPMMGSVMRSQVGKGMASLKATLEAKPAASPRPAAAN